MQILDDVTTEPFPAHMWKEPMTHVMLDLETLGIRAGCAILSIGAVEFEPRNGELGREFYGVVLRNGQIDLREDPKTLAWWQAQSPEARKVLTDDSARPLRYVLDDFAAWLPEDAKLWGNGADFDNPILNACYHAIGKDQPWKPYNGRCYRTIKNLVPSVKMSRTGTHHNALDDAKSQARHLMDIIAATNLELG